MAGKSIYATIKNTLTEISNYVVTEWVSYTSPLGVRADLWLAHTGWLLQSVLWLEKMGLWAPLGLCLIFISSWVGIRIAPKEWALASGAGYDLLIPVQSECRRLERRAAS